ncbi:MAG: hypothetical protein MOB07_16305 [Acidobacteria bacterium]|nr:hypothetical protein [Acidobacteriota bacterium]
MTSETLRETLGERLLNFQEAVEQIAHQIKTESGENWILVFDEGFAKAVNQMILCHYPLGKTTAADCFAVIKTASDGETCLGIISLRRRWMSAGDLQWLLRKNGMAMSQQELLRSSILGLVDRPRQPLLGDFCREMFGDGLLVLGASDVNAQQLFKRGNK